MQTTKRNALLLGAVVLGTMLSVSSQRTTPLDSLPSAGELGGPVPGLTPAQLSQFQRGLALFDKNFHKSEGLGTPEMNADSCRACHQDPVIGGAGGLELNVSRFGNDNGGLGPFTNYPTGQAASKLRPPQDPGREEIPTAADVFEQRQTPSILGAGLVNRTLNAAILANEDPTDADGDGVFGVARRIQVSPSLVELGRFGWKAQVPRLRDFIKDALGGENGLTTLSSNRGFALTSDTDGVPDPEISEDQVNDMLFFLANLAAPQRKGGSVAVGEGLFATIGCATCHVPTLMGTTGPVPLYSNLLLHDVMPSGYRGMAEPGAPAGMFKTPPLWGVSETAPYMHDGRAETLRDAILAHFTEGQGAKDAFLALSASDQDEVIAFLEDL